MANPTITLRITEDDIRKIDELVSLYGYSSRGSLVMSLVRVEHDKVQGSPELKELLERISAMQKQISALRGSCDL